MQYNRLGKSGLVVSRLAMGMASFGETAWRQWALDARSTKPIVARALELGINFFDTADVYSLGESEVITGKLLNKLAKRDEVVVATKVYHPMGDVPNAWGLSRKHIMQSIDDSLRRLKMDYVDLYQIHRWDYATPIEETMEALHDLIKQGKVRYIGASSMYAWQFSKAQHVAERHGWSQFISMQNHYNLIYREEEREMIPLCEDLGVGVIPWSPLARGFLAGKRRKEGGQQSARSQNDPLKDARYGSKNDEAILERVIELAQQKGVTPAQISLAWLLHQPVVSAPILGVTQLEQIISGVNALTIDLSQEEMTGLEALYQPHPDLNMGMEGENVPKLSEL